MRSQPPAPGSPLQLSEHQPLAGLLTLGTGGQARWFTAASSREQVQQALDWARNRKIRAALLGGGSNLICADSGFDGLVIQLALRGIDWGEPSAGLAHVTAAAAEPWDEFVRECCERGLSGVECLSGIPGTVGATPIQNVGAYGQDVQQTITRVRCLDRVSGELVTFDNDACEFSYRSSRFKTKDRDRFVVLDVSFVLQEHAKPQIAYPELQKRLAESGAADDVASVRRSVLELRAAKSMLLDPRDPNGRSCGSFFVNPVIEQEHWQRVLTLTDPTTPPHYVQDDGRVKVPAAWLIERAGFSKGQRQGNVGISTKHSLCLVAHAGATSSELLTFARHVRDVVRERLSVELVPEPVLLDIEW